MTSMLDSVKPAPHRRSTASWSKSYQCDQCHREHRRTPATRRMFIGVGVYATSMASCDAHHAAVLERALRRMIGDVERGQFHRYVVIVHEVKASEQNDPYVGRLIASFVPRRSLLDRDPHLALRA